MGILGAQGLNLTGSATQNAANNLLTLHNEPASFIQNPAAFTPGMQTGATYLFNVTSIPYYVFNLNTKIYGNNIAVSLASLGSGTYRENRVGLGYNFSYKILAAGVNLRFLQTKITGYEAIAFYVADVALAWRVNDFASYICLRNSSQSSYKNSKLPVVLSWESSWQVTEAGKLSLGLEKEDDFDFSYRLGAAYKVLEPLKVICSYQYQPHRLGAGFVIGHKQWEISYGVRTHRYLNLTHFISLGYGF